MSIATNIRRRVRRSIKSGLSTFTPGWARRSIPVLAYHSIDDSGSPISVSLDEFRVHLEILRTGGWRTLSTAEFLKKSGETGSAEREVLITFDDGYRNFLTHAVPALARFGFTATVFVPTDFVGVRPGWLERDHATIEQFLRRFGFAPEDQNRMAAGNAALAAVPLLDWSELRFLVQKGFDVHCHTAAHCFLTTLSDEQIFADLLRSRAALQSNLGVSSNVICYPYGNCDQRVAANAKRIGFAAGFRSEHDRKTRDAMLTGRTSIGGGGARLDLRFALSGAAEVVAAMRTRA